METSTCFTPSARKAKDTKVACLTGRRLRYIVLPFLLVTFLVVFVKFNLGMNAQYNASHPFFPAQPCNYLSSEQKEQFYNLAYTVHEILDELGIGHWLIYGSVFGAYRRRGILPWDTDVDIALNGSGKFASMNFGEFLSAFKSKGLKVDLSRWTRSSLMKIASDDLFRIKIDLFAFYNYRGWMKRAGIETWIFALHYSNFHAFPARLIENHCHRFVSV